MNNLPRVVARIVPRSESNPRPLDHESSALTTTPPSHLVCLKFISKANGVYIRNYLFSMNIMEEIFAIRSFELSRVKFNVKSHSTQCS